MEMEMEMEMEIPVLGAKAKKSRNKFLLMNKINSRCFAERTKR